MDGMPWRVKLTAKPIMAATTASNLAASPACSDVGVDQRQGARGCVARLGARGKGARGNFFPGGGEVEERGGGGVRHVRQRRTAGGGGKRSTWHPLDPETGEGDGALTRGPHDTVMGDSEFDSNSNCKRIRINFIFFQTLIALKRTFLSSNNFK
jgi:hypothetical protein